MQRKMTSFLFLVFISIISSVCYADYDQQCLNDCFSSGHECKYCAWQCYNDKVPAERPYTNTPCPLDNYNGTN